jgi:predicted acylesterase/phospholipase RssA
MNVVVKSIWQWLKKPFRIFSISFKYFYLLFPAFLFLFLGIYLFWSLSQGKDVLMVAIQEHRWSFSAVMLSLVFWVFVTWYSGRILVYKKPELFNSSAQDDVREVGVWQWNMKWIFQNFFTYLLHHTSKKLGYHLPRFMGFFLFTILIIGILRLPSMTAPNNFVHQQSWLLFLGYILYYFLLNSLFLHISKKNLRYITKIHLLILICFLLILLLPSLFHLAENSYVFFISVLQIFFLFIVVSRRPLLEDSANKIAYEKREAELRNSKKVHHRFLIWLIDTLNIEFGDHWVFIIFNGFGIIALVIYVTGVYNIHFANSIGSLPFVMLAFGILLGYFSLVSVISIINKVQLHLILIAFLILLGSQIELHNARLLSVKTDSTQAVSKTIYAQRPNLDAYFFNWLKQHESAIQKDSSYPVFFALADGGASRSAYWAASVLGHLEDSTKGKFSEHLFCLSGASGGSVGNGAFLALLARQNKMVNKKYREQAQYFLGSDFLTYTLARMLGPDFFRPVYAVGNRILSWFGLHLIESDDRAGALETAMEYANGQDSIVLQNAFANPFSYYIPNFSSANKLLPIICINTTRMQDGKPALISNIQITDSIFGSRIDVLAVVDSIKQSNELRLSTAVAMGARFPYVSPAGRIGNQYFVDGGYFDNSGAGAVQEIIIRLKEMVDSLIATKKPEWEYVRHIRFHIIHCTNSPKENNDVQPVPFLLNDLAAPGVTLIGAYGTQTNVNNLRLKKFLTKTNEAENKRFWNVDLYQNNDTTKYPMNWVISKFYRDKMDSLLNLSIQSGQVKELLQFCGQHKMMN